MASTSATEDLIDRVHALPAELFEWIRDLVFTPEDESTVDLKLAYRPPPMLQVNRATRTTFARTYYRETTFRLFHDPVDTLGGVHCRLLVKFLKSLPNTHRLSIRKIHLESPPNESFDPGDARIPIYMFRNGISIALSHTHDDFEGEKRRALHPAAKLSTEVWVRREGGWVRETIVDEVRGLDGQGELYY